MHNKQQWINIFQRQLHFTKGENSWKYQVISLFARLRRERWKIAIIPNCVRDYNECKHISRIKVVTSIRVVHQFLQFLKKQQQQQQQQQQPEAKQRWTSSSSSPPFPSPPWRQSRRAAPLVWQITLKLKYVFHRKVFLNLDSECSSGSCCEGSTCCGPPDACDCNGPNKDVEGNTKHSLWFIYVNN